MEKIYRNTNSPQIQEFEKLLNTEFSKTKTEEGQIVEGIITKKTEKVVYVDIKNGKSEGVIELNELKLLKEDNIEIGSKISVVIEKLEDKNGDMVISREKAKKLKSWNLLKNSYEKKKKLREKLFQKLRAGLFVKYKAQCASFQVHRLI